jgi:hypothetical protein
MSLITDHASRPPLPAQKSSLTVPNVLTEREPEIAQRLEIFRNRVNDMLLDHLAAARLDDRTIPDKNGQHPLPEVKATALVLHMLTKDRWNRDDLRLFDACWREVVLSDLFGDEFEPDRHRIQHCVEAARKQISLREPTPLDRGTRPC